MSKVAIEKVSNAAQQQAMPIFEEIAKRLESVRRRAFELFESRGQSIGHALEDWLRAEREMFGWPSAELKEKDGAYLLQITLPGFEAKDVTVTATPSEIIVHASAGKTGKGEDGNVVWTEFGSNDVYRRFELPKPINVDALTASLEKGILTIKAPESASRAIRPLNAAA